MRSPLEWIRNGLSTSRRSQPGPGYDLRNPFAGFDLEEVKSAHSDLLQRYGAILIRTLDLQFFPRWRVSSWVSPSVRPWTIRPLVQPFTDAHIRRRLFQLDRIYLIAKDFRTGSDLQWLDEAREQCEELSQRLQPWNSWASLTRLLGIPTVAAGLGLVKGIDTEDALPILIAAVFILIYGAVFGGFSFNYKRSYFLGEPASLAGNAGACNTYATEDRLWRLLGASKRLEAAVDCLLWSVAGLGLGATIIVLSLSDDNLAATVYGAVLIAGGAFAGIWPMFRRWR